MLTGSLLGSAVGFGNDGTNSGTTVGGFKSVSGRGGGMFAVSI